MNKNSRIYIAGHTGLIGSAIFSKLRNSGYKNIITKSHNDLDLINQNKVENFFKKYKPEYVFLTAAKTGGIIANDTYSADFIYQNTMIQTNIIHFSYKYKVKKLLYLGCSCMYPKECKLPIKEEYLLAGKVEPTNEAYAIAKISGLKMCQAYNKQYNTNFITVIPSNVYGPNDNFNEGGHVIANLIKRFHLAKNNKDESVTIWGTGKPTRDFIYVDDVVNACVFLMNKNIPTKNWINIASGKEVSIKELAETIKKIVGFEGKIVFDKTKPDGMMRRCLSSNKIRSLGWSPKIVFPKGLKLTYEWYENCSK